MINSYDLTAIFPFLHNGRQFPLTSDSYELAAIFPFLHNGRQFPSTSEEAQTQTLGGLVIWSFSV